MHIFARQEKPRNLHSAPEYAFTITHSLKGLNEFHT